MSIIEQALRRAQDSTTESAPAADTAQQPAHSWVGASLPASGPFASGGAPASQALPPAALALGLAVLLAVGGVWLSQKFSRGRSAPAARATSVSPEATLRSRPAGGDPFVLNGVVEGAGEPYAMINGVIVAIGQRVKDFTLVSIGDGAATLRRDDGKETVLRVLP